MCICMLVYIYVNALYMYMFLYSYLYLTYTLILYYYTGEMEDGSHQMWYEGVSSTGTHSIGLARSTDKGDTWTKLFDGKAIFTPSADSDAWDNGGVSSPHLVWMPERRRWRLYYMGQSATKDKANSSSSSSSGSGGGGGSGSGGVPVQALGVAESLDELGHSFVRI